MKKPCTEQELCKMLEYLEDVPEAERIELAKRIFEPRITINDDEYALYVFDNIIRPDLEDDIRLELLMLRMN